MKLAITDNLSASLAQPLQHAAQTTNGAQFALMLSLIFEAKAGVAIPSTQESNAPLAISRFAPVHIEHSLSRALERGNAAAFNLYNCIYQECPIGDETNLKKPAQVEGFPAAFDRRGRGEEMLKEIEQSKRHTGYIKAS